MYHPSTIAVTGVNGSGCLSTGKSKTASLFNMTGGGNFGCPLGGAATDTVSLSIAWSSCQAFFSIVWPPAMVSGYGSDCLL